MLDENVGMAGSFLFMVVQPHITASKRELLMLNTQRITPFMLITGCVFSLTACLGGGGGGGGSAGPQVPESGLQTFTVTTEVAEGGSITPATRQVEQGSQVEFELFPNPGYTIGQISGCGGQVSEDTYVTGDVQSDCTVTVDFLLLAPQQVAVLADSSAVIVQWETNPAATDYCIYRSQRAEIHPDTAASYDQRDCVTHGVTQFESNGLINGTQYFFVVTASVGDQVSEPSVEVSSIPSQSRIQTTALNDTGIDWCNNGRFNGQACPVLQFPGQDGDTGRDALAREGVLEKTGAGNAGFDFTKIAVDGSDLPLDALTWHCVRDNVTGLIWEVKDTQGGLQDSANTYTWYNPDPQTNGGNAGTTDGGTCSGSACDTRGYIEALNQAGVCGASDWRLPSHQELISLLHNGEYMLAIDVDFFPATQADWYWSATPLGTFGSGFVWGARFGFADGTAQRRESSQPGHIRAVYRPD